MIEAQLCAEDIRASYAGEKDVLHGVSLEIPSGEFTAIIGPNACGKSTLLKCLARMLPLKSGVVLLDGRDIRHYRPQRPPSASACCRKTPTLPKASRSLTWYRAAAIHTKPCSANGPAPTSRRFGQPWLPPTPRTWPNAAWTLCPAAKSSGSG